MKETDVAWLNRTLIGSGLLFLLFTLLLFAFKFNDAATYVAYIFYALMTTGVVLGLVKYFQSKEGVRRKQVAYAIRFFVGLGLILLVSTIPFLLLENTRGADFAANLSYVFLALGVFLAVVEYLLSEARER